MSEDLASLELLWYYTITTWNGPLCHATSYPSLNQLVGIIIGMPFDWLRGMLSVIEFTNFIAAKTDETKYPNDCAELQGGEKYLLAVKEFVAHLSR
jgi:hypothetical protein